MTEEKEKERVMSPEEKLLYKILKANGKTDKEISDLIKRVEENKNDLSKVDMKEFKNIPIAKEEQKKIKEMLSVIENEQNINICCGGKSTKPRKE
tara:strand:+ start:63 stop:347 length:285 start_codon:yes stop_codon:yes gene_type:complete